MLLAIDPGTIESAYIVRDGHATIEAGKISNDAMLMYCWGFRPTGGECCIEMIASYGMPVGAEVFETCVWIGRFLEAVGPEHCHRLPRLKVKLHLCGSARAKDGNIRQAIIDRLGPPGTKKQPGGTYGISGDVWAALALALAWEDGIR